jgi:hypothetical protein
MVFVEVLVSKEHVAFWFLFLQSAFSVVSWAEEVRDPVKVHVPPDYTGATAVPLVLLLHGYGASGNRRALHEPVCAG